MIEKLKQIWKGERIPITTYIISSIVLSIVLSFKYPVVYAIIEAMMIAGNVFWYFILFPISGNKKLRK